MKHRKRIRFGKLSAILLTLIVVRNGLISIAAGQETGATENADLSSDAGRDAVWQTQVRPVVETYCQRCHNADNMESGIRVDQLNAAVSDRQLFLWKDVLRQLRTGDMPPEDEPQLSPEERQMMTAWIEGALQAAQSRPRPVHGATRRMTVSQYRNTLRDLLKLEADLTAVLPPDGITREGFADNGEETALSPLHVEAWFDIAEKALAQCVVDPEQPPVIQNFRMDFGDSINQQPCPDQLILGANSHLLRNQDFVVTELQPAKPFAFEPFLMRKKYRFIEGYQGNATVRGWRSYDSIYHSVFACMRGNEGYPKGKAYELVPEGLLLRPAIPSAEIFGVESTYGPRANFKISLRELPSHGNFRVTVKAARYDDALLLDPDATRQPASAAESVTVTGLEQPQTIQIRQAGIYQADVFLSSADQQAAPDDTKLNHQLIGAWSLNGHTNAESGDSTLSGQLKGEATFTESPFGQAVSVDGKSGAVVVPRNDSMNVADGDFTVAAWIRPRQLRQGGIVCLGKYSWTHGWYFDMPDNRGVLRIESAGPDNTSNGTVASRPGVIRINEWQHVAAVVKRGQNNTRLYVNGYPVATGTIGSADLDNPNVDLHIGRIQDSKLFKGDIDEVRLYRRALEVAEISALVEPGRQFAVAPPSEKPELLSLTVGSRHFSGILRQPAFMVLRLPSGPVDLAVTYAGGTSPQRLVLTPISDSSQLGRQFTTFENRQPRLGVHLGLRRDCGSTLTAVDSPQAVVGGAPGEYVFTGAISNFPSPDTEADNVNYLAGIREIGVRSEYTDGRDMPRLLIQSVEFEGPYFETWPPVTHTNIFIESDHTDNPDIYAREIIRSFATRAFRRPVNAAEEEAIVAVQRSSFAESQDFRQSIRDALLVVLTSPQFLYLIEDSRSPQPEDLAPYELASKLSYFLWNTAPDQTLLHKAATSTLHASLDAEVRRMIRDPQFDEFVERFASQWLQLDKLDVVKSDSKQYPRLTRDTKSQLRREPVRFLRYLIRQNLPLRHLLQTDILLANEVVASYYGLGAQTESGFRFVPLRHDSPHLGGVLTQAGILAGLSNGRESNPVKRGAWLARKIIAEPPDDPPPNVPALPDDDGSTLTLREQLKRHRDQPGCANCHKGIDPWGIPFEEFDAGGLYRETPSINLTSTLPDETEVASVNDLKMYLSTERIDQVAFSFLKHLSCYAVGRSLSYNELVFLEERGIELQSDGYRMQDMIRFLVMSDLFLKK